MRITYLHLENIKSYGGPTRIDFTAGVNAVCGLNGSGKTTVLEAIGYALFDYLPYRNQQAFIREGEKSGTVRVGLLGRDGREYEVVRRVGGAYYVADVETSTRIAERRQDVQAWVKQKGLDLEVDIDLEALFKNAVGVPQGLMTADFQGSAITRKTVFDPLLRVEEYRDAWDHLLKAVNLMRDRATEVDGEIIRLQERVENFAPAKEKAGRYRDDLSATEARLTMLRARLSDLGAERDELEARRLRVLALEADVRAAEYDAKRQTDLLGLRIAEVAAAEEATRILKDSETGYQKVEAARARLIALDSQRSDRENLRSELASAQSERDGTFREIQRLDQELALAHEAGTSATILLPAVARQDRLERDLHDLELTVRGMDQVVRRIAELGTEIGRIRDSLETTEHRLIEAQKGAEEAARIPEVERQLEAMQTVLAELGLVSTERDTVEKEGVQLRAHRTRLIEAEQRYIALSHQLEQVQPVASGLERALATEAELRDERARMLATLEYQEVARAALQRSHCPLLEVQCPVVIADSAVLERFVSRFSTLGTKVVDIESRLNEAGHTLASARAASEKAQQLSIEIAGLAWKTEDLTAVDDRLAECRARYAELTKRVQSIQTVKRDYETLRTTLTSLRASHGIAMTAGMLEERRARDRDVLASIEGELAERRQEEASLCHARERAAAVAAEIESLGDPRGKQQQYLISAARIPGLEARLSEDQARLVEAAGRAKALVAQLQVFEHLDDEMREQREVEKRYGPDYTRFLAHRVEAASLEMRRDALREVVAKQAEAESRCAAVEREHLEVKEQYDSSRHEELRTLYEETISELGGEEQRRSATEASLQDVEKELRLLQREEEKLRARESEREGLVRTHRALSFIRSTINAAGPAVTETLLRNISEGANDIYAEIVDDHAAELRWDRDYEVLVQRGAETRTFAQLSGGEQMSAALAVRLALLKEMSEVDFAFFDEPTQNMDVDRRTNLAGQIGRVRGFDQLIVISHDDTFEQYTDNLIRLRKEGEETRVNGSPEP